MRASSIFAAAQQRPMNAYRRVVWRRAYEIEFWNVENIKSSTKRYIYSCPGRAMVYVLYIDHYRRSGAMMR